MPRPCQLPLPATLVCTVSQGHASPGTPANDGLFPDLAKLFLAKLFLAKFFLAKLFPAKLFLAELFGEFWHECEEIADEAVVGDLEDGRFLVLVDGDDDL